MDPLGPTEMTFGAGDMDGLSFPPTDEHISTASHGLQTDNLPTHHSRSGQGDMMFTNSQLDMSDYDGGLTQGVGMGPMESVMNGDVRVLNMDGVHGRGESELGGMVRMRQVFPGETPGPRSYAVNQLNGFQPIQHTQPLTHALSPNVQPVYPSRGEQPCYQSSFDVSAFLNETRQSQISSVVAQYMGSSNSGGYGDQSQAVQQQQQHSPPQQHNGGLHQQFVSPPSRPPPPPNTSTPTSGISAMLPGIKSESANAACSRRLMQPVTSVNEPSLSHNRLASELFGMVTEAIPSLRLPQLPQESDQLPNAQTMNGGLSTESHNSMATSGHVDGSMLSLQQQQQQQQNNRVTSEVIYQQSEQQRRVGVEAIPTHAHTTPHHVTRRVSEDVSSLSGEDEAMDDDRDEDYNPHLNNVTYKHKKLTKAKYHRNLQAPAPPTSSVQTRNMQQSLLLSEPNSSDQTTQKKNSIEGITLDVGPDGATRVKMNFVPGQTLTEELVAAFQNVIQDHLKQGQENADASGGSTNPVTSQTSDSDHQPQPQVLELSFKLTTPEKTKAPAAVKEYDKPKRSWKERAHHEQEGRAEVGVGGAPPPQPPPPGPADAAAAAADTLISAPDKTDSLNEAPHRETGDNEDSQGN